MLDRTQSSFAIDLMENQKDLVVPVSKLLGTYQNKNRAISPYKYYRKDSSQIDEDFISISEQSELPRN